MKRVEPQITTIRGSLISFFASASFSSGLRGCGYDTGFLLAADLDSDHYLRLLKANTPHPRVSDLVFHSPSTCAEHIVDEALNHRGFAL
ncbi:hypothetical protein ACFZC3_21870 [Streptomyces sp. NPDC007903]|uniref:hypothetical protein n=1 Tax=Streptomyces sp. NPDC007903 TaxID=3364786 RepID=UPI0036EF4151